MIIDQTPFDIGMQLQHVNMFCLESQPRQLPVVVYCQSRKSGSNTLSEAQVFALTHGRARELTYMGVVKYNVPTQRAPVKSFYQV